MKRGKGTHNLLVILELNKRSYKAAEKQRLIFSMTNESGMPIRVLKWHTPLEGIKSDMFSVESAGKRCVYLGRVYKRGAPTEADYITIPPGKTVKKTVDLTESYDVAEADNYSVRYKTSLLQVGLEEPKVLIKRYMKPQRITSVVVRSNVAVFELRENRKPRTVDGILADWPKLEDSPRMKKLTYFHGCSLSQQGTLASALAEAAKIADGARTALSSTPNWARYTAPRYKEWFGAYESYYYNNVCWHFDKIWDALANKDIVFDCSSTEDSYAYVYPTQPYAIYLCKRFWTAPLTGTDSQSGTLVHETSHFNVVTYTDDHEYGQTDCRSLAKSNRDYAIDNADSHEYFAENSPALTMDPVPGSILTVTSTWNNMPAGFSGGFDAALNGGGPFAGKCYFFKGDKYIRYDWVKDRADSGYPASIAANWRNLPAGFRGSFDAAVNGQGPFSGKCYFFKGDSYIRYDWGLDRVDPGYPAKIATYWRDLPTGFKDNFDTVFNGAGPFAGKCYFFKGDYYVCYDWQKDRADPGYPRKIADYWHCLPNGYTGSFDAGLEGDKEFSGKGYLFKGNYYIRYNWEEDRAEL